MLWSMGSQRVGHDLMAKQQSKLIFHRRNGFSKYNSKMLLWSIVIIFLLQDSCLQLSWESMLNTVQWGLDLRT